MASLPLLPPERPSWITEAAWEELATARRVALSELGLAEQAEREARVIRGSAAKKVEHYLSLYEPVRGQHTIEEHLP